MAPPWQIPKQGNLVDTMVLANEIHRIVEVAVDVVVESAVLVYLTRITPVVEVDVDPLVQQITDQ
ncbi:hypothetical protein [Candidatus Accumulibacter contiguus]|jgi:hypothetical protein|uniref:hypothetical protein n=1 Tax=Candidatus Accumulibacter contiguus TaxID=2954381 RepID=UPI002FC3937B